MIFKASRSDGAEHVHFQCVSIRRVVEIVRAPVETPRKVLKRLVRLRRYNCGLCIRVLIVFLERLKWLLVCPLPDAKQDVTFRDGGKRNEVVSLNHSGEIEIVLARVYFVFLDLSDLCREKPVTLFVML